MFWGTPSLQFIPWWRWAWQQIFSGRLPLWNPMLGMGAPLIANYQSAIFYPPHWIYGLFYILGDTALMAWAQGLMVAIHLILAAVGMAMLVRRLGLGQLAQTVAGLSFGFSGYLVARAGFLSINAAVVWLPWIIWCLTPRAGGGRITVKRYTTLVLFLVMQFLAGHAQTTWYTMLLAGVWTGLWAWRDE